MKPFKHFLIQDHILWYFNGGYLPSPTINIDNYERQKPECLEGEAHVPLGVGLVGAK